MAHHLAELLDAAQHAGAAAERSRAKREATETILKVWAARASLPRGAYPLSQFREVLSVIRVLSPDANPYVRVHETKFTQAAAEVFESLTQLVIALVLLGAKQPVPRGRPNPAAVAALQSDEQQVTLALTRWVELFAGDVAGRTAKRRSTTRPSTLDTATVLKNARQATDAVIATAQKLRDELGRVGPSGS
jgi:hypothetical protein